MASPDKDQKKGDEILRRLLETPPQPKKGEGDAKAPPSLSDEKRKDRSKAK
ncbi:hypothetical protein [Parvibaculum sp.]|uniref:hypothetical protein n=1 Tax=Parvibaculum sp. TaxID=2024848 RepID=UPI001B23E7EF|nr:hypothetical protein [Parvibaculum sp.]MBO6669102.1 hypothetical protein [Parvibaculum sp.]MBO6692988.1 hypothetical protein [Parvibaculum sp.]MBO6715762.1 hypothetical protein [Parvibaculum sp.]